jgi:hypothetical protein
VRALAARSLDKEERRTALLSRDRSAPDDFCVRVEVRSQSIHTSVSPSCVSGCLLRFLVSADLSFPQSPSARSA